MKIELIHPITHNGTEYGRGVHDLEDGLAKKFLAECPDAAVEFKPGGPVTGSVAKSPDAPKADISTQNLSAADALEYVHAADNRDELQALLLGEQQRPGGERKSVVAAINARIAEWTDRKKE